VYDGESSTFDNKESRGRGIKPHREDCLVALHASAWNETNNQTNDKEYKLKRKLLVFLLVTGCIALFLTGCLADPDDSGVDELGNLNEAITVNEGTIRYFSLSTGEETANPASQDWDIAFDYTRMIYTNSGATADAVGSGGQGGVWASNTMNFAGVTSTAGANFTIDYAVDTAKYTSPAAEMGAPALNRLNVITYVGYTSGTGTEDDPLTGYAYDQKQYYEADLSTMPPVFSVTNRVYIVKHSDGEHYSKVQITAMDSISSAKKGNKRIYAIVYETL
jgi:hypothetical protein